MTGIKQRFCKQATGDEGDVYKFHNQQEKLKKNTEQNFYHEHWIN